MFKFLEKAIEFFSMIKIALSPILLFTIIGTICYLAVKPPMNIALSIFAIVLGIILGVWWAIYIHKKHGATEFNARLDAFPELDKNEKK